ncbi:TPA: hypothetical protein HA335_05670 [Methanocaldococcus jannaschii]|nr:hypothetical protein [Methanocaldococcus jannaschii]HII60038.1 hypothetical protein [Methanocaldococcus jannaschii]
MRKFLIFLIFLSVLGCGITISGCIGGKNVEEIQNMQEQVVQQQQNENQEEYQNEDEGVDYNSIRDVQPIGTAKEADEKIRPILNEVFGEVKLMEYVSTGKQNEGESIVLTYVPKRKITTNDFEKLNEAIKKSGYFESSGGIAGGGQSGEGMVLWYVSKDNKSAIQIILYPDTNEIVVGYYKGKIYSSQ